jgi:hypothetical protein
MATGYTHWVDKPDYPGYAVSDIKVFAYIENSQRYIRLIYKNPSSAYFGLFDKAYYSLDNGITWDDLDKNNADDEIIIDIPVDNTVDDTVFNISVKSLKTGGDTIDTIISFPVAFVPISSIIWNKPPKARQIETDKIRIEWYPLFNGIEQITLKCKTDSQSDFDLIDTFSYPVVFYDFVFSSIEPYTFEITPSSNGITGQVEMVRIVPEDIPDEITPIPDEGGVIEKYIPYLYSAARNFNQVELQWQNPDSDTIQPIIDCQDTDAIDVRSFILPHNSTSALISNLISGKEYSFTVKRKNRFYTSSGEFIGTAYPGHVHFDINQPYSQSIETNQDGEVFIDVETLINNSNLLPGDISGFFVGHKKQADPVFIEWTNTDKVAELNGFANCSGIEDFWVQSWDKAGNTKVEGIPYDIDTFPPLPVKDFKYNLLIEDDVNYFTIELSWKTYADDPADSDVDTLMIKGSSPDNFLKNNININTNVILITNIPYDLGKSYHYEIQAVDNKGNKSIPSEIDFIVSDKVPYKLNDVSFDQLDDSITVSWGSILNPGSSVKIEYGYSHNFDISKTTINNITGSPCIIKGLNQGEYEIKVYVINKDGISSKPVSRILTVNY